MKGKCAFLGSIVLATSLSFLMVACEDDDDRSPPPGSTTTTIPGSNTTVILSAPTQTSPANGATLNHFPRTTTLVWSEVDGADRYGVEVEYDSGGVWKPLVSGTVDVPTYTFTFIGMQAGRWRVWAIDADNNAGPQSGWFEFTYTI